MSQIKIDGRVFQPVKEEGEEIFRQYYLSGMKSLPSRINHKMANFVINKTYPMINKKPMLTFTFDDISLNAAENGAKILEAINIIGTFYITTSMVGKYTTGSYKADYSDLDKLYEKGHEIALHTHFHRPIIAYSCQELSDDIALNKQLLNDNLNGKVTDNFCYPYGMATLKHKRHLQKITRSARYISNMANHTNLDPHHLKSVVIDADCVDEDMLTQYFEDTCKNNGWLILVSHQVGDKRERLVTNPAIIHKAIELAKKLDFDCVTIEKGLDLLNVPKLEGVRC
jgi:peptidoglycan/xylan/chitin deacetylase (PgdA/CDA1 family)